MKQEAFNFREGSRRKEEGLDRVEGNNADWVALMRDEAIALSRTNGRVHIDDLRAVTKFGPPKSKNAWGAIFRGPGWRKIGYEKSRLASNHSHVSPVWVYDL